jgi:iron complex transport system substrate-binding protein
MRIVSLLPSATEIICALGLQGELVGVTHECDYPPEIAALPRVTRTAIPTDASSREIDEMVRERLKSQNALYTLDLEALETVAPDLLVTQALCDVCAVAEAEVREAACSLPGMPRVLNLEPMNLDEVLQTLLLVGEATGCEERAEQVVTSLRRRIAEVSSRSAAIPLRERPRVGFLEWIDPLFNGGHWNPQLVEWAGGVDVLGSPGERSRTIDWDALIAAAPEVLFIACCGFKSERTLEEIALLTGHPRWHDLPCAGTRRVYVTDGNAYFSRPGPRLVDGLEIMAHALHPGVHPLPGGMPPAIQVNA